MEKAPNISGRTKLFCLIGSPVEHSLSPAMHTASFSQLGVDAVYLAFDVKKEQLEDVEKGLKQVGALGYNVTMPLKTAIVPLLDELSDAASLIGAVNTVVVKEGKTIGHNTDGIGFVQNMRCHGVEPQGKTVTLVGTGGAGFAILAQLALDGVKRINVFKRKNDSWDSVKQRIAQIADKTSITITLHDLTDRSCLAEKIALSDIFINATKVGMAPLEKECVIDANMLHDNLVVADAVYNPRETKLIKMAKDAGLVTVPGLGMLLHQAAAGEKIWIDADMPIDYIEAQFF